MIEFFNIFIYLFNYDNKLIIVNILDDINVYFICSI